MKFCAFLSVFFKAKISLDVKGGERESDCLIRSPLVIAAQNHSLQELFLPMKGNSTSPHIFPPANEMPTWEGDFELDKWLAGTNSLMPHLSQLPHG